MQKLRKPLPNSACSHGLSLLESQELNLLDQNRLIGLFLTHSDPVFVFGVAFPRLKGFSQQSCHQGPFDLPSFRLERISLVRNGKA